MLQKGQYGHVGDLRGALTFYRLSGRLANLIYSMDTTNTDFYAYQYKPVLNFLDSPCGGILIADEVGLGKTIEAGLIWTELRSRADAQRLLVLCPAMLREKWEDELLFRFGIQAHQYNAGDILKAIKKYRSGDQESFSMIASMQGVRPPRGWKETDGDDVKLSGSAKLARYLVDQELEEPIFDAIIVDEAHYLRNPDSQTAKLGRLLRPVTKNLILLSATPIQLKSDDLFHLLNLLDEDSFPYRYSFKETLNANGPLVELREKLGNQSIDVETVINKLKEARSHDLLAGNRQLNALIENPPTQEQIDDVSGRVKLADTIDRVNLLSSVVTRTRKRDVNEWRVIRQPVVQKVEMSEVEENFYINVTERVRDYCGERDLSDGFMLTIPQRQMCSSMPAACRAWHKRLSGISTGDVEGILYEDTGQDIDSREITTIGPLVEELIDIAERVGDYAALYANDSKYMGLLEQLKSYWLEYPDKKIVLFSYYRETLRYLNERLQLDGVKSQVLMGGMDKHAVIQSFKTPDGPQILLSSEVASEGIDLQFSSFLINYDLPWNPMRVEQRIGRIDRLGQLEPRITIWNIFYENTIDDRIYTRLYDRLDIFEQALGGMEAVLGDEVRQMSYDLLRHELTPGQEKERIDMAFNAVAKIKRIEEQLEDEAANLVAHGDYVQNKVKAAKELNRFVSGEDLYHYFHDFINMEYPGSRFVRKDNDKLLFEINLVEAARIDIGHYLQKSKIPGKTRLAGAGDRKKIKYLFHNKVGASEPGIEVISQYHPIVRFISQSLKGKRNNYHPIVAVDLHQSEVPGVSDGTYFYHVRRWSVQGGIRDIEQLVFKVFQLDSNQQEENEVMAEKLVTSAAMHGKDWHAASNTVDGNVVTDMYGKSLTEFEEEYNDYVARLKMENNDRVDVQIQSVEKHRDRRVLTIEQRIANYRMSGKPRMIPLEEGRMRSENERADSNIARLEKARMLTSDYRDVSVGVIRVTA